MFGPWREERRKNKVRSHSNWVSRSPLDKNLEASNESQVDASSMNTVLCLLWHRAKENHQENFRCMFAVCLPPALTGNLLILGKESRFSFFSLVLYCFRVSLSLLLSLSSCFPLLFLFWSLPSASSLLRRLLFLELSFCWLCLCPSICVLLATERRWFCPHFLWLFFPSIDWLQRQIRVIFLWYWVSVSLNLGLLLSLLLIRVSCHLSLDEPCFLRHRFHIVLVAFLWFRWKTVAQTKEEQTGSRSIKNRLNCWLQESLDIFLLSHVSKISCQESMRQTIGESIIYKMCWGCHASKRCAEVYTCVWVGFSWACYAYNGSLKLDMSSPSLLFSLSAIFAR